MELLETILTAIQDMPYWMRFIIIGLILVVVIAPYVIGYINARETRRAQQLADAQKEEYEKQRAEQTRLLEELRNEAAREKGNKETIHMLIENNQSTMARLSASIDRLDERNSERDKRLETAINNQATAIATQTATLAELIQASKQNSITAQATLQKVTSGSEQTHSGLAKMQASLEAINGTIISMKDAMVARLQAIDNRMDEDREHRKDEHNRMFNQVQTLKDIQASITKMESQLSTLERLDETLPMDDSAKPGDNSEDKTTHGNDKKDKDAA